MNNEAIEKLNRATIILRGLRETQYESWMKFMKIKQEDKYYGMERLEVNQNFNWTNIIIVWFILFRLKY